MGRTLEEIIADEKPEIVKNAKRKATKILHEIRFLERRRKQDGPVRQGKRGDAVQR